MNRIILALIFLLFFAAVSDADAGDGGSAQGSEENPEFNIQEDDDKKDGD